MKIFFISTIKIYHGNSAGASRIMNYARAFTLEGNKVFFCSLLTPQNITLKNAKEIEKNIYAIGEESIVKKFVLLYKMILPIRTFFFVLNRYKIFDKKDKDIRIIQYPSIHVSLDFWVVLFLIKFGGYKVFLEVNEVRKFYIDDKILPKSSLKSVIVKIYLFIKSMKYKFVERLASYYSGLICISTNIKEYFNRYNKNTIRIPILISDYKPSANSFKKYNINDIFFICFSGSIHIKKEAFDIFFNVLSNLKNHYKNFELHLYGPFPKSEKQLILESLPTKLNIKENIKYFGEKNPKELPDIFKERLSFSFTQTIHYAESLWFFDKTYRLSYVWCSSSCY